MDGYASLIISILILITGYQSGVEVISVLLGQRPNLEIKEKIEELVTNDLRLLGYHDLQVHDYGPSRVHANVDVELDDFEFVGPRLEQNIGLRHGRPRLPSAPQGLRVNCRRPIPKAAGCGRPYVVL